MRRIATALAVCLLAALLPAQEVRPKDVREIAKGRVWTGVEAKSLGLVDEVGGFYQAVEKAKSLAHLSGQTVRLKTVTVRRSPFDALGKAFGMDSSAVRALMTTARVLSDPRAQGVINAIDADRLRADGANVLAPLPRF